MMRMNLWMLAAVITGACLGATAPAADYGSIAAMSGTSASRIDVDLVGLADIQDVDSFVASLLSTAVPDADGDTDFDVTVDADWATTVAPDGICQTYERYIAARRGQGGDSLDPACALDGPCDDPLNRDAEIPTENTPIKTYRLSIHVFCENNGSNCAATQSDVDTAVARLNTDYAPWRIQFVYETNFINKTTYRYLDPNTETFAMKRSYANSPATKLNVFVVDTGGGCWGSFPWWSQALTAQGGIVMDDTWFVANTPLPTIFTHEVGHCLGLWHVFHGVDEVTACSACYEPAGRSDAIGDNTGDRCSDTNPTPTNVNNCFDPTGTDACSGNPWLSTPYLNYMSYSHTCPIEFTPQQAGRMHCWSADVLTGWMVPPNAPGTPTLTKNGTQITIAWADNSNDEVGFRVQREKKSNNKWINTLTIADVGSDTTSATDAPGPGTFRYRVVAYNAAGDSAWSAWAQISN